mmetsp:Transcript_20163/g.28962  ORF Transcript_20163/g.28962 Transcript_20163/m.28962 type:complete len:275 (+) Transcript_20163:63-887(+)
MGSTLSSLVFQPPSVTYLNATKNLIWLDTKSGVKIPAFYINRKCKVTLLFSHGNAEDLGMIYEWFCELSREIQVNVLAYDYEGYGKAPGVPSEKSCYENIEAAYSHLTEKLLIPPENIVLYGRSLGSGPSTYLAHKLSCQGVYLGGLVLQSPVLSIYRVAFNFRFTLPGDMFPNVDRISSVCCPIYVIHGTRDEVVPFWNGEDLFLASPVHCRAKPFWVDGAGHNNIETITRDNGVFYARFKDFLDEWVSAFAQNTRSQHPSSRYVTSRGIVNM